jgi:hypothetical protein
MKHLSEQKSRTLKIFISTTILLIAVLACGSAVSSEFAFQTSKFTKTSIWCRLLIMPQIGGDSIAMPKYIRPYCVGKSHAQFSAIEGCLGLSAPDKDDAYDMRHHCIDALAHRHLNPELCSHIKELDYDTQSSAVDLYQDRCRAWSISREEQCFTGFLTEGWREGVAERCFEYLAVNHQDHSFCQRIQDEQDRRYCLEAVERAGNTLY